MMKMSVWGSWLGGLFMTFAWTGCANISAVDGRELAHESAEANRVVSEETRHRHPGGNITFSHDPVEPLAIGESVGIALIVQEGYAAGELVLEAIDAKGVSVFGATKTYRSDLNGADLHNWRINVRAETPGIHYVGVRAQVDLGEGHSETRTFAVRVEVIDPNLELQSTSSINAETALSDGEPAMIMDAEESID